MKTKAFIVGTLFLVALNFGFSGCSRGGDSMFGEIPSIYEEELVGFLNSTKELINSMNNGEDIKGEDALLAYSNFEASMKKAEEKAQPLADEMIGKTIPYTMSDSLPYRIVSDIKITKVLLPEMKMTKRKNESLRLEVEFDVVFTQEQNPADLHYFIMSGDQPIGYSNMFYFRTLREGDTLHVENTVRAPEVPAKYLKECEELRFVTAYAFLSNFEQIEERKEAWKKAFDQEFGLDKE